MARLSRAGHITLLRPLKTAWAGISGGQSTAAPTSHPSLLFTLHSSFFTLHSSLLFGRRALFDQRAADHYSLYLISPLIDLGDLSVAHVFLDRVVPAIAVSTEQLDRVSGDFHRGIGSEYL